MAHRIIVLLLLFVYFYVAAVVVINGDAEKRSPAVEIKTSTAKRNNNVSWTRQQQSNGFVLPTQI